MFEMADLFGYGRRNAEKDQRIRVWVAFTSIYNTFPHHNPHDIAITLSPP